MLEITFERLVIEGFKSFTNPALLDLKKRGTGLHFMRGRNKRGDKLGSNGAGKSSVWDALCWCLYGRTVGDLRNPDVQSWYGDKDTTVSVSVRSGVKINKMHVITRATNPNRLLLDGTPCGQEQIEQIIGMGFMTFTHTVLMGQGRPLFFDLDPRHKMELFSDVLNLDRWEQRSEAASTLARKLERELDTWEGELRGLDVRMDDTQRLLNETRALADTWASTHEAQMKEAQGLLTKATKAIEAAEAERGHADLALESAEIKLRGLATQFDEESEAARKASLDCERAQLKVADAKKMIVQFDRQLDELKTARICPTCGQPVKVSNLAALRVELIASRDQLRAVVSAGTPKALKDAEARANHNLTTTRASALAFKKEADAARDKIDAINKQLTELKANASALRKQVESWDAVNPHTAQVDSLRNLLRDLKRDHKDLEADINARRKRIARVSFWVKGFKDVRLLMIDEVLQELELATETALASFGLTDWSIKYQTHRETKAGTSQHRLNVLILSPDNDKPVKWESWSGGEGQRLRIAGALALSEVLMAHAGVSCNLEVLDEPTQHLSIEGVRDLCAHLADRAHDLNKQVWYIDHMSVESSHFKSITTVTKTGKGSEIL